MRTRWLSPTEPSPTSRANRECSNQVSIECCRASNSGIESVCLDARLNACFAIAKVLLHTDSKDNFTEDSLAIHNEHRDAAMTLRFIGCRLSEDEILNHVVDSVDVFLNESLPGLN